MRSRPWRWTAAGAATTLGLVACAGGGDDEGGFDFLDDGSGDEAARDEPEFEFSIDPDATTSTVSPADRSTVAGATTEFERPDIPPLICDALLTIDDADEALAVWDRPDGERGSFGFSQGEVCLHQLAHDDSIFVRIEPGQPGDFAADTNLDGITGQPVDGVGDEAMWFRGADSSVLAVHESTELGELYFRIALHRPELDEAGELDAARTLALAALPRFPGVEVEPVDVEEIVAEPPPPEPPRDLSGLLAEQIEAGEDPAGAAAEALAVVTGATELDESSFADADVDVAVTSGTPVVLEARRLLEDGVDPTDERELTELLDRAFPSDAEVATMMASDDTDGDGPQAWRMPAPQSPEPDEETCESVFGAVCMTTQFSLELDAEYGNGKYRLVRPQLEQDEELAGWTDQHFVRIMEAFETAAPLLEMLGDMPEIRAIVLPFNGAPVMADYRGGTCLLDFTPALQAYTAHELLEQWVARGLADCFLYANFGPFLFGDASASRWWWSAFAWYLSAVAYPDADYEGIEFHHWLAGSELSAPVLGRGQENVFWFERLVQEIGLTGAVDLLQRLPVKGDQVPYLGRQDGVADAHHDFAKTISEEKLVDPGSGKVIEPFRAQASSLVLDAPTDYTADVPGLWVSRIEVEVPDDQYACLEVDTTDVEFSWGPGERGDVSPWFDDPPDTLEFRAVFLVTSVSEEGQFRLRATDLVDDPDDCDPEEDGRSSALPDDCPEFCGVSSYYYA